MKNYHMALFIMSALITNNIIADEIEEVVVTSSYICHLYTSPTPRDRQKSRMPACG